MSQTEIINKVLTYLTCQSVRIPIPFSEEESFRVRLGIHNHHEFSHACHYMESEGYVNYVHTHGLQITGKGVDFIENKKPEIVKDESVKSEPKFKDNFEPYIIAYSKPKPKPEKKSFWKKIESLLTIKIK